MALLIKRWEHERTASATVILAEGLLGAVQRSTLTGLHMIAPPPHPMKIFGNLPDAVAWLYPHLAPVCPAATSSQVTLSAVEALCGAFKARGP